MTISSASFADKQLVRIAKLAFRPAPEVQQRWQPLVDYLNEKVPGYRFQIKALGYQELETAIAQRNVDFVFTNPGHYLLMTYRNGLSSPLATLIQREKEYRLSRFGGVVITRSGQMDIQSLEDIRRRRVAAVTQGSLGGYQAQAMELFDKGIEVSKDVQLFETGMPHDRVVRAVLEGRADVGFVRTGILEGMAHEGRLDLSQIQVIAPQKIKDFPFMLSTRLYPEWPFSAMPGINGDLARKVAAALLSMPHGGKEATALNIYGFKVPADYEVMRVTLKALRLPPFEEAPEFTLTDIWQKYQWPLIGGVFLVFLIMTLVLRLWLLNRRLAEERKRIERTSHRWQHLLWALGEGVYGVDAESHCSFINPAALAMLGFSEGEVLGKNQHSLFHYQRENGEHYPEVDCPISLTLGDGETRRLEDWFWRKDGSGFPVSLITTSVEEDDGRQGAVVVFQDISARRQLEKRLRKEARTDALTRLANRRLFMSQLRRELSRIKRSGDTAVLMMADLDHFKLVNDQYGHAVGDAALRHFARLAKKSLRASDAIGRLGGEEFGMLLPLTDAFEAMGLAERLRALVEKHPLKAEQGEIAFTVSLGVTELDLEDEAPEEILERADSALYQAKKNGRNRVEMSLRQGNMENATIHGPSFIRLRWKRRYECGESRIDQEHRTLFLLANHLLDQLVGPDGEADWGGVKAAFDALLSHLGDHFRHEEKILRANGYQDWETHATVHRAMLEKAGALRSRVETEKVEVSQIIDFLIIDTVILHMLHEDCKFYGLFKGGLPCPQKRLEINQREYSPD
jgi:diguanylate cyclase (GGDEF)-like protein/hemerythrin-like metal-binding protein/PAS domain S-box-containing protein